MLGIKKCRVLREKVGKIFLITPHYPLKKVNETFVMYMHMTSYLITSRKKHLRLYIDFENWVTLRPYHIFTPKLPKS